MLSPNEEKEKHRRELEVEIARTVRSITGMEAEIVYYQKCLEIEREYLAKLDRYRDALDKGKHT